MKEICLHKPKNFVLYESVQAMDYGWDSSRNEPFDVYHEIKKTRDLRDTQRWREPPVWRDSWIISAVRNATIPEASTRSYP
jgi:hypothetical protein